MEVGLGRRSNVGGLRVFLALRKSVILLKRKAVEEASMFPDPDEAIIIFLLIDPPHVLIEIVINILAAIAGIKGLQEKLMVVLT